VTDKLAELKRTKTRQNLIEAYDSYTRREAGSLDRLMVQVRKFAFTKVSHLEHEHSFKEFGTAETADDWAQEVSIKVWQGLTGTGRKQWVPKAKVKGKELTHGELFYAWVHKIANNQGADAFNDLLEEKKTKVSLFTSVDEEDEKGKVETFTEENPLIHDQGAGYGRHPALIPASVTGRDREICIVLASPVSEERNGKYITRGRNYAEVAQVLGMTEAAVTLRLHRLRERVKAENEQKMEEARHQLEAQRKDTLKARYERFRSGGKS